MTLNIMVPSQMSESLSCSPTHGHLASADTSMTGQSPPFLESLCLQQDPTCGQLVFLQELKSGSLQLVPPCPKMTFLVPESLPQAARSQEVLSAVSDHLHSSLGLDILI